MKQMKHQETKSRGTEYPPAEIIIRQERHGDKVVDVTVPVRLIGRKLHLLRCVNGTPTERGVEVGGIIMPEVIADRTWWYTILAVSPDCKYFKPEHIGGKIKLTDNDSIGNSWRVGPAERIVREEWLESRTDNPFCVVMEA